MKIQMWPQTPRGLSRLLLLFGIAAVLPSLVPFAWPLWLKLIVLNLELLVVWLTNEASTKHVKALCWKGLKRHIKAIVLELEDERIKAIVLQTLLELGLVPANHREQDLLK